MSNLRNSFEIKLSGHEGNQQDTITQKLDNLQSGIWMQESQKRNTGQFNEELAEIHAQGESL